MEMHLYGIPCHEIKLVYLNDYNIRYCCYEILPFGLLPGLCSNDYNKIWSYIVSHIYIVSGKDAISVIHGLVISLNLQTNNISKATIRRIENLCINYE